MRFGLLAFICFLSLSFAQEGLVPLEVTVRGNCVGQPVTVTVADIYTGRLLRAEVRWQRSFSNPPNAPLWYDIYYAITEEATGSASIVFNESGTYALRVRRAGYQPYDVENYLVRECASPTPIQSPTEAPPSPSPTETSTPTATPIVTETPAITPQPSPTPVETPAPSPYQTPTPEAGCLGAIFFLGAVFTCRLGLRDSR